MVYDAKFHSHFTEKLKEVLFNNETCYKNCSECLPVTRMYISTWCVNEVITPSGMWGLFCFVFHLQCPKNL
jgi:hypothetical protein